MCLAIFKPANVSVPIESLKNGWIANPGGGGFAFAHKGKIVACKGFMTLKEFMAAYEKAAQKYKACPGVVHFRIPSMGSKDANNTHPFDIEDGVLIHNGTIDGTGAMVGVGESDTKKFADMFKSMLTFDLCTKYKKELNNKMGWNKLVMLYKDGRHVIINESVGVWQDEVWYSNHTFKPKVPYTQSPMIDDDWRHARD